jgi:MFS family permease
MRARWISDWNPNDEAQWRSRGWTIARRNLVFSILVEFLGFSVWQLWSVVAPQLDRAGFGFTLGELFWLISVPGLVGATLRFPYGLAVPLLGGRRWTVVSAALLLVPASLLPVLVQRPETPFWVMLLAAATAGFGGGNFASSMSNISFFYPDSRKGWALGLNAAGGNIGVAVVQLVVPAVIGLGVLGMVAGGARHLALQNAGLVWVPLIVAAAVCAYLFMDDLAMSRGGLPQEPDARVQRVTHSLVVQPPSEPMAAAIAALVTPLQPHTIASSGRSAPGGGPPWPFPFARPSPTPSRASPSPTGVPLASASAAAAIDPRSPTRATPTSAWSRRTSFL